MSFINTTGVVTSSELGNFINGLVAKFYDVFDQKTKELKPSASKYFSVIDATSHIGDRITVTSVAGIGELDLVAEGADIPDADLLSGEETTFKWDKFAKAISVTQEAIDDNKYPQYFEPMAQLSEGAYKSMDKAIFQVLNGGFGLAATVNGAKITRPANGERLFSVAHALSNGGTQSNVLEDSPALSADALARAKRVLMETQLDNGAFMDMAKGFRLFVAPANYDKALAIVKSTLKAGTDFNDINTQADVEVVVSPYLGTLAGGSDTAWYLQAKDSVTVVQVVRKAPSFNADYNVTKQILTNTVSCRYAQGHREFRGIVASLGDGSTVTV